MAERLKTEQALNNSEQRFRAIFDAVNDAIFVQDLADGRILDVNQKMCEMYGYTVEEARQLTSRFEARAMLLTRSRRPRLVAESRRRRTADFRVARQRSSRPPVLGRGQHAAGRH